MGAHIVRLAAQSPAVRVRRNGARRRGHVAKQSCGDGGDDGARSKTERTDAVRCARDREARGGCPRNDDLCGTARQVLPNDPQSARRRQKETPAFKSFYLNEAERQKYAGLGSTPIEGFGTCKIQQSMTPPGRLGPVFASYYCTRPAAAESDSAAFAASASKNVAACLQSSYFFESSETAVKSYTYEMVLQGYPRVRIVHERNHSVVIYLDAK